MTTKAEPFTIQHLESMNEKIEQNAEMSDMKKRMILCLISVMWFCWTRTDEIGHIKVKDVLGLNKENPRCPGETILLNKMDTMLEIIRESNRKIESLESKIEAINKNTVNIGGRILSSIKTGFDFLFSRIGLTTGFA
jgi:hypothetical protein